MRNQDPVRIDRMTEPTARVLGAFLADPRRPQYGGELLTVTGIEGGTLYPILTRLAKQGVLIKTNAAPAGDKPRRQRFYFRLTADGHREALRAVAQWQAQSRTPGGW